MLDVQIVGEKYHISFKKFDYSLVEFCKQLQGRRYNAKTKTWTADRTYANAKDLHTNGYIYDHETLRAAELDAQPELWPEGYQWTFNFAPLPHQQDRISEFEQRPGKFMLRGDMGVGKTFMAMMWMHIHQINPENVLIVCPNTLVRNWVQEFKKFANIDAIAIQGTTTERRKAFEKKGVHVVNYEYVVSNKALRPEFAKLKKTTLILDESHKIKNPSTQRSKVFHKYAKMFQRLVLMTGTPVSQGAQDYYSQFKCINPKLLGSTFTGFKNRYCEQEQIRGAPIGVSRITGYRKLEELTALIAPFMIDINKNECLDLPDKVYTTRYIDLTPEQSRDYKSLQREMALWVDGKTEGDDEPVTAANILTRLIRLSQITQGFVPESDKEGAALHHYKKNPKLEVVLEVIEEEIPRDEPVLVICRFKQDVANLRRTLTDKGITFAVIDGDTPIEDRMDIANAFQRGDYKVLIGQIQTVGIGLNLDRASHIIFYSNNYSLTDRLQAEDRIHRATTRHRQCVYIDIVAQGTLDEQVIEALRNKKSVADQLATMVLKNKRNDD